MDCYLQPCSIFYDTSISYFDMERVGGLASYLYKAHHIEVSTKLSIPDYLSSIIPATQHRELPPGTPMPGVIHVSTAVGDQSALGHNNRAGVSISAPAITIAVPRLHPLLTSIDPSSSSTSSDQNPGTIGTSASTDQATVHPHINIHSAPPPPPLPPRLIETTVNASNEENASSTSSGEAVVAAAPAPQFGALITGTPSGHNMLVPMLTDFRSLVAEQGFTFYPGGFLGFANFEHRTGVQPQNPAVALLGKDFGSMDVQFSLRELLDDAIIIFTVQITKLFSLSSYIHGFFKVIILFNPRLEYNRTWKKW